MKTLLTLLLLLLYGCKSQADSPYTVTIYGVNTCGYTVALKNDCDKNGIVYTYKDVNQYYNEFVTVVNDYKLAIDNYVNLPVVKVVVGTNSYGFSRPSIEQIKSLLITLSNNIENPKALVYPNPVRNILYLSRTSDIEVYNSTGTKVIFCLNRNYINMSYLDPGIYTIKTEGINTKIVKL